jgi:hypothetical protein
MLNKMEQKITKGTLVDHDRYGEGVVVKDDFSTTFNLLPTLR